MAYPRRPPASLSAVKAGITRLRTKGGASAESMYDLVNGYVTAARTIRPRPGSAYASWLPEGTVGLALLNGVFQVFTWPGSPAAGASFSGFDINVITHPDPESVATIRRIWKAEALMGGLYVVAEWTDNPDVAYHYWVRSGPTWTANTAYQLGGVVEPVSPNGIAYIAGRLTPAGQLWTPDTEMTVGMVVEPTVFNGYEYEVMEAYGTPPRTGPTEPAWIAADGAAVIEEADQAPPTPSGGAPTPAPPGYGNPGGSLPPNPGSNPGDYYQQVK